MRRIFACSLVLGGWLISAPAFAASSDVAVYNFEGKTSMRRDNTVYQLDYDMMLKAGDIVRSDEAGSVDLTMNSFAALRMNGETECLIKQIIETK